MSAVIPLMHLAMDSDTSGMLAQIARRHRRGRFKLTLATLGSMTDELRRSIEEAGVELVSLDARSRRDYVSAFPRLVSELRRRRIRIFHAHLFDPALVGLAAAAAARVSHRVLTRHHSDYHTRIRKTWHIRLDRLCTLLSHRVIAVSEHTKRVMLEEEGAPSHKVTVIHNGIDFDRVREPSPESIAGLRAALALHGQFVIAVVARLHPEKGYEHLLQAMPRVLAQADRPVRLLVAGTGPYREEYELLARELGISESVTFLGFRSDVITIMSASDLVVLPSVAEAFGLVLTEAMFLGKPVVATTAGAIPEIVEHGRTGLLVPPAAPEPLADAIVSLIRSPDRVEVLGRPGRQIVLERFRFETMMARYEDLYEELLSPG